MSSATVLAEKKMPAVQLLPELRQLWEYWRSKRGARDIPERADIDPTEIPALLPHISLFEIVEGRFRFRLAGRVIVEAHGMEPRGKFLDDVLPADRAQLALRAYKTAVERRRPVLASSVLTTPRGFSFPLVRLLLPLGVDGAVSFVLAGLVIEKWADTSLAPLGRGTAASQDTTLVTILDDEHV